MTEPRNWSIRRRSKSSLKTLSSIHPLGRSIKRNVLSVMPELQQIKASSGQCGFNDIYLQGPTFRLSRHDFSLRQPRGAISIDTQGSSAAGELSCQTTEST